MAQHDNTHDEVYEINLRFDVEPASVQSSRDKKDAFASVVRAAVAKYDFYIVDDVTLVVEWELHEQAKYESDRKADIDNIVKPLFDSLSGPDGLLVDDNLIQSFYCGWLDQTQRRDIVHVRIRSVKSESITEIAQDRKSLAFVEVDPHLYFPMNESLPGEVRRMMIESVASRFSVRRMLLEATGDYHAGQSIMPIQRMFHKSRVVKFPHYPLADYLAKLPPAPMLPIRRAAKESTDGS